MTVALSDDYNALIYPAGLQAISDEVLDAATVDRASRWLTPIGELLVMFAKRRSCSQ